MSRYVLKIFWTKFSFFSTMPRYVQNIFWTKCSFFSTMHCYGQQIQYSGLYALFLNKIFFFLWLLGLFTLPGHIDTLFPVRALYPEPRPYEILIYRHRSSLRALTAGRFRPTRPPTVVGKVCFVTSLESGLSPLDIVCMP